MTKRAKRFHGIGRQGYEYDGGSLVLLSDDELELASPVLTRTIDVAQFVRISDIDPIYFDKPYYLLPGKGGAKGTYFCEMHSAILAKRAWQPGHSHAAICSRITPT